MRLLEQANAGLAVEVCPRAEADGLLRRYARLEKLAAFGKTALAARLGDPVELSRITGTSVGRARETIRTGCTITEVPRLAAAVRDAEVSLDQADEIARTAALAPDAVDGLLDVARRDSFCALKGRARSIRLQAEADSDLSGRQHDARKLRHWVGELGMVHIKAELEPHVGAPIVDRLERRASRLARSMHNAGTKEPFERHLADSLATLCSDGGTGAGPRRAEVVVLVDHQVAERGWQDVRPGEKCDIPGVGPIAPQIARRIAQDAFLTGIFYDGTDLRNFKRWTRNIPTAVRLALQLGEPPDFQGPRCVDCGNRYQLEGDHRQPHVDGGPASTGNIELRCRPCHARKTTADRRDGKLGGGDEHEPEPP